MKIRLLSIGAAAGLSLGIVGTAAAVAGNPPAAPFKACANAKSVLSVESNGACAPGSVLVTLGAKGASGISGTAGKVGATGAKGPQGPSGVAGPDGQDGVSFDSGAGVPSGFCAEGDSDIDLANGEVYSCRTSTWGDAGQSLMGPAGRNGTDGSDGSDGSDGVSVTTTQLDPGDTNCPFGGISVTGANGTTYLCDSEPSVEDVTWTPTLQGGVATSATEIEDGSTLQAVKATLTGDLSACTGGFSVEVSTDGIPGELATWSELSGSDYATSLTASSGAGASFSETGTYPLVALATCEDSGGNSLSWPSGVQLTITLQWTHAVATRTIS